ncbi:MAG: hypothetical protein AB2L09_08960 [Coriobacteriia bacterium]
MSSSRASILVLLGSLAVAVVLSALIVRGLQPITVMQVYPGTPEWNWGGTDNTGFPYSVSSSRPASDAADAAVKYLYQKSKLQYDQEAVRVIAIVPMCVPDRRTGSAIDIWNGLDCIGQYGVLYQDREGTVDSFGIRSDGRDGYWHFGNHAPFETWQWSDGVAALEKTVGHGVEEMRYVYGTIPWMLVKKADGSVAIYSMYEGRTVDTTPQIGGVDLELGAEYPVSYLFKPLDYPRW